MSTEKKTSSLPIGVIKWQRIKIGNYDKYADFRISESKIYQTRVTQVSGFIKPISKIFNFENDKNV